jgi:hypothetical protein
MVPTQKKKAREQFTSLAKVNEACETVYEPTKKF